MAESTSRTLARGAVGFLLVATYAVVAGVTTLAPPPALVGTQLNVATATGLAIAGTLASAWVGVDTARGRLAVRRVATFVLTGWVLVLPFGAFGQWLVGTVLGAGSAGVYAVRVAVFAGATVGAAWMAYGGGWERARRRMGSGGLERM